jgi:hypothetical protein
MNHTNNGNRPQSFWLLYLSTPADRRRFARELLYVALCSLAIAGILGALLVIWL